MDISIELRQRIVEFLTNIPNIRDSYGRQALLQSAGVDKALLNQLSVDIPPTQFVELLVSTCLDYGELQDGRHALESVGAPSGLHRWTPGAPSGRPAPRPEALSPPFVAWTAR